MSLESDGTGIIPSGDAVDKYSCRGVPTIRIFPISDAGITSRIYAAVAPRDEW